MRRARPVQRRGGRVAPGRGDELGLGRLGDGLEAGRERRRADRREVHGRRQVLAPDVAERVAAHGVAGEGAQRPVAPRWRVQGVGLLRVVDEHDQAAIEARRRVGQPAVDAEADLGDLAVLEPDALPRRAARPARRRWAGPRRRRSPRRRRAQRTARGSRGGRPTTRWTGQRVEDLVGDDDAGLRRGRRRLVPGDQVRQPEPVETRAELVQPRLLDLDRAVADRLERAASRRREGEPSRPAARAPVPAPCSLTTNGDGRPSASHASSSSRAIAAPKIGWASGAVRKSPERPGPASGAPVVAVTRLVQRPVHEPGEGDRAARLDLRPQAPDEHLVLADGLRVGTRGRGRATPGPDRGRRPCGRSYGAARRRAVGGCQASAAERQAGPGSDERVAAEQDRNRRVERRRGELAQPRVADPAGEQEVAREAVLGGRPGAFVGAEPVGEQDARVEQGPIGQRRNVAAQRSRAVALEQLAQDAPRRPPVRAPGRAARAAGSGGPAPRPGRGSATASAVRASGGRSPTSARRRAARRRGPTASARRARQASHDRGRVGGIGPGQRRRAACAGDQEDVQRRVHVDRQPPPPGQVADGDAGRLREPARQRVVRGEVGDAPRGSRPRRRSRSRRPSSGGSRGRPAGRTPRRRRTPTDRPPSPGEWIPPRGRSARPAGARSRAAGGGRRMGYRRAAPGGPPRSRLPRRGSPGGDARRGRPGRRRGPARADPRRVPARGRGRGP